MNSKKNQKAQSYITLSSNMKILVIADPKENALPLQTAVKKLGFNNTHVLENTLKSIEFIQQQQVEFIFCQYKIPNMDALELMEEIFNDPQVPRLPFVIFSQQADEGDLALMREREADSFIQIPCSQKAVSTNVTRLFNKYNSKSSHEYLFEQARKAVLISELTIATKILKALTNQTNRIIQGRAFLALGQIFAEQKAIDQAVECFQQALTRLPFKVHPHQELGKIYLQLGFTEQALQHFKSAIAISPKNPYRYHVLSRIYLEHEKYSETLALIEEAEKLGLEGKRLKRDNRPPIFPYPSSHSAPDFLCLFSPK